MILQVPRLYNTGTEYTASSGMGLPIFFVDPLEVVKAHHQRGDAITMLLVLRDPRASLQNKALVSFRIFFSEKPWGPVILFS